MNKKNKKIQKSVMIRYLKNKPNKTEEEKTVLATLILLEKNQCKLKNKPLFIDEVFGINLIKDI